MNWLHDLSIVQYLAIGVGLLVLVYFIIIFNHLVTLKNNVKKAWSNIDVLLKQRHDELPKLVTTCKQYMEYEKDLLEAITKLRGQVNELRKEGDINSLGKKESELRQALGRLFALAENYPDLKANQSFIQLQNRISSLENAIADRRELYNESATLNNTRIEQFPDLIVAKSLRFKAFTLLEFTQEEIAPVDMNELFKDS